MRRREKEVTDPAEARAVLARGEVLRLAMIAADGAPYVVPLSFVAAPGPDGLRLWVHSAGEGRKIEALRADPRVCFEVTVDAAVVPAERVCDFSARFTSVIGAGRAVFVESPEEKVRALEAIGARYAGRHGAVAKAEAARVQVIEIRVESLSCKRSPAPRGAR
jgi:nitroimidazol reductase NimA-like FMN-containing flavoprotein (pyridoxamine 5'-phosphate oxidase superfamily)